MSRRRAGAVAFGALLGVVIAGCGLISGADALQIGTDDAEPQITTEEAGSPSSDASDDPSPTVLVDSGADAASPPDAARPDGGDAGYLRAITFESNMVTGPGGGADVAHGNPLLVSAPVALSGQHSLRADKSPNGVEADFAPLGELYVTMLVRFERIGAGDTTFLRFVPEANGTPLEISLPGTGTSPLRLVIGGTPDQSGGSVSELGPVYRLGIHMRHDVLSSQVEVFLAAKGAAFVMPIITTTVPPLGRTTALIVGAVGVGNMKLLLDDVFLATTSMPAP